MLCGEDAGVSGVVVAPAQIVVQPTSQHCVVGMVGARDDEDKLRAAIDRGNSETLFPRHKPDRARNPVFIQEKRSHVRDVGEVANAIETGFLGAVMPVLLSGRSW